MARKSDTPPRVVDATHANSSPSDNQELGNPFDPEEIRRAYKDADSELGRINVLVIGKTGVGKSTLLNTVFASPRALTGLGEPVTTKLKYFADQSGHLGIYDTVGFEIGHTSDELLGTVMDLLRKYEDKPDSLRRPHLIWFCSDGGGTRIEPTEQTFVKKLASLGIPVFWVLTQVPSKNSEPHERALALSESICDANLNIVNGSPFLLCAKADSNLGKHSEFGVGELVRASFREAPAYLKQTFASVQGFDLDVKSVACDSAIKIATAASTAIGATPIPFSDAPGIAAAQVMMMMRIAHVYNLSAERATLVALTAGATASAVGKSAIGNLLKFIPGVGTLVGGLITGSVAGAMTFGVGKAWKEVCSRIYTGEIDESVLSSIEYIRPIFLGTYKKSSGAKLKANLSSKN